LEKMRDKEIVGLYQAYLDVYSNSNEEVEQLDEDVQGAVKGALEKGANIMKTNPVLKAVGSIIAPANPGRKTPTATSGGYRKEEVEELDEVSDELVDKAVNARIAATGAANKREIEDRTPENMRDSARAGEKEASMKSAAANRKKRRMNKEEVEKLDEAGLPYGPVGKGFEKLPAGKKRAAMMKRASALRTKAMKDDGDGGKGSPRGKMGEINAALTNPRLREETDLFDAILEHLVAEGYADTNESALAIMANMSEEWRESIVEGEEKKEESQKPFTGEGPKKPKGWRPTGPKLKSGQRPGYAR
jgi:hypothetical protein